MKTIQSAILVAAASLMLAACSAHCTCPEPVAHTTTYVPAPNSTTTVVTPQ